MSVASRGCTTSRQEYVDSVIEAFYDHLLSFQETAAFFRDPRVLEYVKGRQKEYFIRLTQGDYEEEYVDDRLRLGSIHEQDRAAGSLVPRDVRASTSARSRRGSLDEYAGVRSRRSMRSTR